MSTRNRNRGKRHERAVVKLLGGMRTGVLGGEDIYHSKFSIECKSRQKIPKWFAKMWEQTLRNCKDKIPILVLHELHKQQLDDLVVISMRDFLKLLESTKEPCDK